MSNSEQLYPIASPDLGLDLPSQATIRLGEGHLLSVNRQDDDDNLHPVIVAGLTADGLLVNNVDWPVPQDALQLIVGSRGAFTPPSVTDRRSPIGQVMKPVGGPTIPLNPALGLGPNVPGEQSGQYKTTLLRPINGPAGFYRRLFLGSTIHHENVHADSGPVRLEPGEIDPASVYGSLTWDYENRAVTVTMPARSYLGIGMLAVNIQ